MPIYEYLCTGCHHTFDVLQKLHDEPVRKCPKCSEDKATRLVSAAGFQLKGTGWYATDFKNKGGKKPENEGVAPAAGEVAKKTSDDTTTTATTKGDSD